MRTWWINLLILSVAGSGTWAQAPKGVGSFVTGMSGFVTGLKGEYFNGPNFGQKVMTRTDPQVDFNWNWQSPGPGVPREYFSVRWTGKLYAPTSGTYRFSATVDDGVRVWVNGKRVIDEWRKQDDSQFVGEIALNGGRLYDLRIEYYNDWKGSVISVYWERPEERRVLSFTARPHQAIPAMYLFRKPDRPQPITTVVAKREPVRKPVGMPAWNRPSLLAAAVGPASLKRVAVPTAPKATAVASMSVTSPKATYSPTTPAPTPVTVTPAPATEPSFATLKPGEVVVLRRVVFSQSEYTLLPESYPELDKLVQALQANPALRIEIGGHTDNLGDNRLNQALSEYRAKMVANYLNRRGIADSRILTKGYGGSRPVADNTSEAQRALNRRVELVIL